MIDHLNSGTIDVGGIKTPFFNGRDSVFSKNCFFLLFLAFSEPRA